VVDLFGASAHEALAAADVAEEIGVAAGWAMRTAQKLESSASIATAGKSAAYETRRAAIAP
jgi:hypothetical protein